MMGSTHKAVGIVTGLVLAVCGFLHSEYMMVIMLFVVPAGAMLPDIDHNNSKLGRERKKFVEIGCKVRFILGIPVCVYGIHSLAAGSYKIGFLYLLAAIMVTVLLVLLPRSKWIKRHFKFFTKHRGIMHTLVVPGILPWLVVSAVSDKTMRVVLVGLAIGYLTHLAGDCLTKDGCPILWPFTKKCISLLPVTTNTKSEKFVAFLLCTVISVCTVMFYNMFSKFM